MTDHSITDRTAALAQAAAHEAAGRWLDAIDTYSALNRQQPDDAVEARLVELRARAFDEGTWPPATAAWPPPHRDPFAGQPGIPEITADQLSIDTLAGGVLHHGSLLVRGLVPPAAIAQLTGDIDRATDARNAWTQGVHQRSPWFSPCDYIAERHKLGVGRKFIAETGGTWAADSPRALFHVMELYRHLGLRHLLQDYFGERPCVSVRKWVLRRVAPQAGEPDWHQDGSFMGTGVRSVNLWIALSDCGGDSENPGIDVVPRRLDTIVQTGTHGARFEWTVGPGYVDEAFPDTPWVRPVFKAGDALFFDHFNLHRTSYSPTMTGNRYAIECWFFASSLNPAQQIPIVF